MALKKNSNPLDSEQEKFHNEDNKEENENIFFRDDYEKRLLYTAITRAKNFLDIYCLS